MATYREFNRDLVSLLSYIPCRPSDNVSRAAVTSVIKKKKRKERTLPTFSHYAVEIIGVGLKGLKMEMEIKNYIENFELFENFFLRSGI